MSVTVHRATYDTAEEVVDGVFERAGLDLAGKRVFVKPNILGAFPPERGITTHPAVVRAVTRALVRRGADVVVGDNPGMRGYGVNEQCARRTGILDAAEGRWRNVSLEPVSVPSGSKVVPNFLVSRIAMEADLYVSVPKFKTHVGTVLTGGIKNSYGLLVGGQKALLHRRVGGGLGQGGRRFAEAVVDVFALRPPDFVVVDGIVAMQGNGPSSKDLRRLDLILAGANAVEVDAVMAHLMGLDPGAVPLLRAAKARGLGEIDLATIDVEGPTTPVPDFKVPLGRWPGGLGALVARLLTYVIVGRPALRRERCARCGLCARQCPVGAITLNPYPTIDHGRCVLCYCCNEFCEHDAMDVERRVRLLRRRPRAR